MRTPHTPSRHHPRTRVNQYSRASVMESKCRGVLGPRLRGGRRAKELCLSIPRHEAWAEDRFEVFGAVAVGVGEVFVGDAAQLPAQFAGGADGVEPGALAHDGLNGVDVMR